MYSPQPARRPLPFHLQVDVIGLWLVPGGGSSPGGVGLVSGSSRTEQKTRCSCDLLLPALVGGSFNWSHYSAWSLLVFPEDRRLGRGRGGGGSDTLSQFIQRVACCWLVPHSCCWENLGLVRSFNNQTDCGNSSRAVETKEQINQGQCLSF